MSKEETMNTRFGEMLDLMACMAIEKGADEAQKKLTMEEILELK